MKGCRCDQHPCVCCPTCRGKLYVLMPVEELLDDDGAWTIAIGYKPVRCTCLKNSKGEPS